jgi:4-diphosphocytidyl-2-C-methyl-D-erythritol kinase
LTGALTALARAKVNLTLHVTGRREDGYHLLDSLVVFPELGDLIEVEPASGLSLTLDGPFGQDLGADENNLVFQAAELIRPNGKGAAIHLTKSLPIASGIGGGSSDAAATLIALSKLWNVPLEPFDVLSIGADVPVCLAGNTTRMSGIGERLQSVEGAPPFWIVLVNPGVQVSTPSVFGALETVENPAMPVFEVGDFTNFINWLAECRNDLQAPAIKLAPVIGEVLEVLTDADHCALARMSGSGATCFGIFETEAQALDARTTISASHPLWWCAAAPVTSD